MAVAWEEKDWAQLRTLEGLGLVLIPLCAPDHGQEWAGCAHGGMVPIDLATGWHMRDWTARQHTVTGIDLDAFRRIQEARAHAGRRPYGVGALTGRPMADGRYLVAIDIDGQAGIEVVRRLLGANRAVTATYRTGGGGWRLLYAADKPAPNRNADGGHEGIALCADGRQVVVPPSGHRSGMPYRWLRSGPTEIADLPSALREWAAEGPALARAAPAAVPAAPSREPADVDRELRLWGVPAGLRLAVAAPYQGGDRSGHWWSLTQRLLAYSVSDALLVDATRVAQWGYGTAYRDPGRAEPWLAATLGQARAAREQEAARHASMMAAEQALTKHQGAEIGAAADMAR